MFNSKLFECARHAVRITKVAFIPPGAGGMPPPGAGGMPPPGAGGMPPPGAGGMPPPGAGGAPPGMPMDPSTAGGAPPPPGGGMPMDPSMAGGAPPPPGGGMPMDPSMAGGAPPLDPAAAGSVQPPAGGQDPEAIRNIIREELALLQGGKSKGSKKVDPSQLYAEQVRTRKLLTHLFGVMGIGLPPSILDDEPAVGDGTQDNSGGNGGGDGKSSGGTSSSGSSQSKSAIAPIQAVVPAFPTQKAASADDRASTASALLSILRSIASAG